jgi:hypothetical protein
MNATSAKPSKDKTGDDPEATHASTKPEIGTTSHPRHPNIVSNTTDHTYSSRSQRPPNYFDLK